MSILNENQYGYGGYKVAVVSAVLILMQFLMVYGRYYSRRLQKVILQADDYVLILATVGFNVVPINAKLSIGSSSQSRCVRLALQVGLAYVSPF